MTKKAKAKAIKHVERIMRNTSKGSKQKMDPVTEKLQESHTNAREAALATLDPKSAIERGFLPGVCDGQAGQTVKFFSTIKHVFTLPAGPAGGGLLQLLIAPYMYHTVTSADTWDAGTGIPTSSSYVNDDMYVDALAEFQGVRCVAQAVEIRCLDNPLDLSGERTMCLGGAELYEDGYTGIVDRKDVYTIGNNKPGEVSRYPNISAATMDFRPANLDWFFNTATDQPETIHVVLQTDAAGDEFLVTVYTIWEGLPLENSLITPTMFVGDPDTYSAAISAALDKVPLNSHERISYEDDGVIASVVSDVSTILGAGKKAVSALSDVKKTVGDMGSMFDSFGSGIGSIVSGIGGLFASRNAQKHSDKKENTDTQMTCARLWIAIRSSPNPVQTIGAFRELMLSKTDQEVYDFLKLTLNLQAPPSRSRLKPKAPRVKSTTDEWVPVRARNGGPSGYQSLSVLR
jgi:hypothetical protein